MSHVSKSGPGASGSQTAVAGACVARESEDQARPAGRESAERRRVRNAKRNRSETLGHGRGGPGRGSGGPWHRGDRDRGSRGAKWSGLSLALGFGHAAGSGWHVLDFGGRKPCPPLQAGPSCSLLLFFHKCPRLSPPTPGACPLPMVSGTPAFRAAVPQATQIHRQSWGGLSWPWDQAVVWERMRLIVAACCVCLDGASLGTVPVSLWRC